MSSRAAALRLDDLPPNRPAGMPLTVVMRYNQDDALEIEVTDETTGRTMRAAAVQDDFAQSQPLSRETAITARRSEGR